MTQMNVTTTTRGHSAKLQTEYGDFEIIVYDGVTTINSNNTAQHIAMVKGDVSGAEHVLVRVHSACLTSEALKSVHCDCALQLERAQARIASLRQGVLIYLSQEGRGIGLGAKIGAYALQNAGHDTVDANRLLGLPDDVRSYQVAADILKDLRVASIVLMTNNPHKVSALGALGVKVDARAPHHVPAPAAAAAYLNTKRIRMGHSWPHADETPA